MNVIYYQTIESFAWTTTNNKVLNIMNVYEGKIQKYKLYKCKPTTIKDMSKK